MRSIELFAGAGGLGMGLHEAGFKPKKVIERDRYCCDTIRSNSKRGVLAVKNWHVSQGDVRDIDFRQYENNVSLISGGPPCQPFSMGGKHRAHGDSRDMFPEAIRAVREAKPKAFIFENVKGLTRASFHNYYEYIRLQLQHPLLVAKKDEDWKDHLRRLEQHQTSGRRSELRYILVSEVLNAANYGVPQKRERVFFVGFRSDLKIRWGFPEATHSSQSLIRDQAFGTYWDRHKVAKRSRPAHSSKLRQSAIDFAGAKPWITVRDAICDLPDPELDPFGTRHILNHHFQPGARSYVGHTGSPLDAPAKTLKAGVHGVPGGENMLMRPDGSVRYFSIRESARLQTFPDDYAFSGSWSEAMRQLGNAVPVDLATFIGRDVAKHLKAAK